MTSALDQSGDSFAIRLISAIREKGTAATINLDPVRTSLPRCYRAAHSVEPGGAGPGDSAAVLADIRDYCSRVIRVVAPLVPVIKLNIAYFEVFRGAGVDAYFDLIAVARRAGLVVIGDIKRGDVGHTATAYATAHLRDGGGGLIAPDAVTISGYFGYDGVKPFIEAASTNGRGVFVLVRTSNVSAATVQDVQAADGQPMHDKIASLVSEWNAPTRSAGAQGYGSVGAVVATRNRVDAVRLRSLMPGSFFLVPGYGAQGGRADDFLPYFDDLGLGALVAAGRSVIYAYESTEVPMEETGDWEEHVASACREFVADLARVVTVRG